MISIISSILLSGIEGTVIRIEADVSDGMPIFSMVGILASEVKEAKERVRIAIKNEGYRLLPKRITVNLSPADGEKKAAFDLPIALAVLASFGYISQEKMKDIIIVGELSLNGAVHGIAGVLPIVYCAKKNGFKRCMLPFENQREGLTVEGMEIIPVHTLAEAVEYFHGKQLLEENGSYNTNNTENIKNKDNLFTDTLDFSDIKGQEQAKRAAVISAAGFHNLLFIDTPGTGKTMIAERMNTILPELSFEESMEISKIYSVAGLLNGQDGRINKRPFRSPHHSISPTALVGGGHVPKPGEISLASGGILFLDELPEFHRATIELLRQPLEEKRVNITRMKGRIVYPANFMLVCAMNPCPCGYFPDRERCTCGELQVKRYLGKISRPLLDRIDLCVEVLPLAYNQLVNGEEKTSKELKELVENARKIQKKRYEGQGILFNSQLSGENLQFFCALEKEEQIFLKKMFDKFKLSARAYHRILRVARTVADLEEEEIIQKRHLAEAFFYRGVDKKYWEDSL